MKSKDEGLSSVLHGEVTVHAAPGSWLSMPMGSRFAVSHIQGHLPATCIIQAGSTHIYPASPPLCPQAQ